MRIAAAGLMLGLVGCGGTGEWVVTTWGEDYIEQGIPAEVFADGCSVVYDRFTVNLAEAALLDGNGDVAGLRRSDVAGGRFEVTEPGPQEVGSAEVPATHYDTARFVIAPDDSGESVGAAGTLTCGEEEVTFDWSFATETTYLCEPEGLTIARGGSEETELTIHGDHLFYDGLEDADAEVRGLAIVEADADGDGAVTQGELAEVGVAGLGYAVGQYSEVSDLGAFVAFLTQTLGHVNGEGHCQVDL